MGKTKQQIILEKLYHFTQFYNTGDYEWGEKLEEIIKEIEKSIIEDKTIGI
tara:strand:+ start:63 stop:215 length:153 start_codon:yes stop_codon:yes gene_type:complete